MIRNFNHTLLPLALVFLLPMRTLADVQWHNFGTSSDRETFTLGHIKMIVETQTNTGSGFPGDDLVITAQPPGGEPCKYQFSSAYGSGSVAIYKNLLFLKYGVGRGTWQRVDHVKALRLDHNLDELVDVQSSFYVLTNPHNATPDLFEYRLNAKTEGDYTKLTFSLPKPQRGLPSVRIVRLKSDGQMP